MWVNIPYADPMGMNIISLKCSKIHETMVDGQSHAPVCGN